MEEQNEVPEGQKIQPVQVIMNIYCGKGKEGIDLKAGLIQKALEEKKSLSKYVMSFVLGQR